MNCKRCGSPLPAQGYICKKCGMMMSSEQIDSQKKFMAANQGKLKPELVSEKYGGKKQIYESRDKEEVSIKGIVILFIILLLILLSIGIGLILTK